MSSDDYMARVNRAIDYIVADPARSLDLERVAKVARFSPYHFHRIFKAATGETLLQFVKRVRLQRALVLLSHDPQMSMSRVASECGFNSLSDFSRSFRQRFGVPPSAFDVARFRTDRRQQMQEELQSLHLEKLPPGENPDGFEVVVRTLPPRIVAYIRVHNPYAGGVTQAAERLVAWAEKRGLDEGQWLGYQWDDPELVALEKCRYDVGVEIPNEQAIDGDIGVLSLPEMLIAEIEIRGSIELEQRALDYLFGTWLPQSHAVPASLPAFEAWIGKPFEHGSEHFELRLQVPLTPRD